MKEDDWAYEPINQEGSKHVFCMGRMSIYKALLVPDGLG